MRIVGTPERWRPVPVPGYGGAYSVSNRGRVRSERRIIARRNTGVLQRVRETVLRPKIDPSGYRHVALSLCGVVRTYRVHRLVALAFVSGHFAGAVVNHRDGDPGNNNATNLEWTDSAGNAQHSAGRRLGSRKLRDPSGQLHTYTVQRLFCEQHGLVTQSVTRLRAGRRKSHRGWTFPGDDATE